MAPSTGEETRPMPKRLFMLDGSSDREDEGCGDRFSESSKEMFLESAMAAQGSSAGGQFSEENSQTEKKRDDVRRYHALMELLTTEVGYLMDLREMVNVSYF